MMAFDEFKLCKGCPAKGARYFDPDGYWCCRHPDAAKQREDYDPNKPKIVLTDEDIIKLRPCYPGVSDAEIRKDQEREEPEAVPFVCMKTCPVGHWKRTIEGGQIPKGQSELVIDSEWEP
jgi:hypothetical protein